MNEKEKIIPFTKEMKENYTVLVPNMLDIHFEFLVRVFNFHGYNMVLLKNDGRAVVDEGLKYVHNDTCYPALLIIGQFIDALNSGKYDLDKTALLITQTGGGCRASNYIHLLRKALIKAGYGDIPVLSLNISGLEKEASVEISLPLIRKVIAVLAYGDLLMLLRNQVKPYEVHKGDSDRLVHHWVELLCGEFDKGKGYSGRQMKRYYKKILSSFADVEVKKTYKERVGIVGEIFVKYSPLANNHLEEFLVEQDCEVHLPGLMHFMLFIIDTKIDNHELYGGSRVKNAIYKAAWKFMMRVEDRVHAAIVKDGRFRPDLSYKKVRDSVNDIIGHGCVMGEGWLLTAEMMSLIESGCNNIICAQPFGCLPNHIVGKGMIRKVKGAYPDANIVPIDYDPGATQVNQENRIKLMLAVAKEKSSK